VLITEDELVEMHLVAAATAEVPDRRAVVLALDVPQRDVDRAHRTMEDVAAERTHSIEVLPVVLDPQRILPDEVCPEAATTDATASG
jgi:hypothetical protein